MGDSAKLVAGLGLQKRQPLCLSSSFPGGRVCSVERKRRSEADNLAICGESFLALLISMSPEAVSFDFLLLTFLSGWQSPGWKPCRGPSPVGQRVLFPLSPF